jgi:hypothetical protein
MVTCVPPGREPDQIELALWDGRWQRPDFEIDRETDSFAPN